MRRNMHLGSDGASCRHAAQRWLMRPNCARGNTERDPGLTPRPLLIDPGVGTAPKPDAGPSKGQVPRAALDESARNVQSDRLASRFLSTLRTAYNKAEFVRAHWTVLTGDVRCVRSVRSPARRSAAVARTDAPICGPAPCTQSVARRSPRPPRAELRDVGTGRFLPDGTGVGG
jgi:hypothetical protein